MAQMQEYGIIDKPKQAPEPVKVKVEAPVAVAKPEVKDGNNQEWKSQFKQPPVGSYEV